MEVSDTGIGMTPDQLNRIFNPFQQADDSITRHFGGTGLGLAIVHELVLLMGGEITVESTFNKGTTFRVALNLPIVAKTALADNNSKSEPMLELPTGLKILVAEDNPTNVIVVKRFLDKIKAEVTVAADGAFALEAFTQNTFDLILMDLHMPRVSGMDAVLAIRERETKENRPKTPIVALTADVQSEVISKCFEIGFNGFLEKPLKKEALYRAIHESLVIGQKMSKTA